MKTIITTFNLLFSVLLVSGFSFSQTAEIAAKSHGSNDYFSETDNFGLPPMVIDSIIYLNDSTIIEVTSHFHNRYFRDTVVNHPYIKGRSLDEFKSYFPPSTQFVGFENIKKIKLNNTWILALILLCSGGIYVFQAKE
jgi:hypothetical protein